jgi:hypothetical protein
VVVELVDEGAFVEAHASSDGCELSLQQGPNEADCNAWNELVKKYLSSEKTNKIP